MGLLAVGGTLFVGFTAHAPLATLAANRWSFVGFAVCVALLLWRLGGVHAKPSSRGLLVRNLVATRRLAWPEVLAVHMTVDDPWVVLDLADGGTLAVMAIQRADGERGMREARRLAHLVRTLGEAPDPA
ncbi:PH domain-containing protein [Xylanimonas sp. McL0601]|uniref:PH domain-containing protein n=1 Tax=Xylanimonas sp. McL0601 TaxID=3414739 RepID=UPI003CEB9309